jgi:hypothetical protein
MHTRQFFGWSLCLPLTFPLLVWAGEGRFNGSVRLFLVPLPVYVPVAIWAWLQFRRAPRLEDILGITIFLPLLFAGILAVASGVASWGAYAPIVGFAAGLYGLFFGYGVVAVTWVFYCLLKKARLVTEDITWTPEHP